MKPELCDHCGKATWYAPEASCRACDWPASLRAPNVQIAKAEQRALYRRYEQARDRAEARGCAELFSKLEQVAARSKAVVTVGSHFAYHFLNSEKEVYSPYGLLVGAMVRAPYSLQADRQRRVVESWLFGQYADQIVYASLSSDGTGLASYGLVHMTLDERTIAHRASVLEENSVTFARRYLPGSPLPRATDRLGAIADGWPRQSWNRNLCQKSKSETYRHCCSIPERGTTTSFSRFTSMVASTGKRWLPSG